MREFARAMRYLGFGYTILDFPDRCLAYCPLKEMVSVVEKVVGEKGISMLAGFSPFELTYGFDHPDHNMAGEVARLVSTGMGGERKLWLWKSDGEVNLVEERLDYAKRFYPSQCIPREVLEKIGEKYLIIR